ncbi:MAG: M23 family metallopeptidase [Gammaproteobacteria bacterium]|nr:M23 family metallopeptidase [Gammaproteobacteria bacterium]
MNIIVFPRKNTSAYSIQWSRWYHFVLSVLVIMVLGAMPLGLGYHLGSIHGTETLAQSKQQDVRARQQQIEITRDLASAHVDALVLRLGIFQAHINRLDALGSRLVKIAGLDEDEFDFNSVPGVGGPNQTGARAFGNPQDYSSVLEGLAAELEQRESQLRVLDRLIMSQNLEEEVFPAGWPIKKGWISSNYGKRKNPFSGDSEFHKGVDFAGKAGSDVIAVAGGVVTWAGKRSGYGNLVEIDHGNRLVTRYGHNKVVEVEIGSIVKKGQVIAKMGSTGRSTGPHVHLEVIRKGKKINPYKFIRASK